MTHSLLFLQKIPSRIRTLRSTIGRAPFVEAPIGGTMRALKFMTVALVALGTATSAFAQEEEDREIKYKARTEIDFDAVDVDGELIKPNQAFSMERRRANFNPLIRMREDFNLEMKQSIDEIK